MKEPKTKQEFVWTKEVPEKIMETYVLEDGNKSCDLCHKQGHTWTSCPRVPEARCRKCGEAGHLHPECQNRAVCVCGEFPGHVRLNCPVVCVHCQDKNGAKRAIHQAMTCRLRCCVCGKYSHAGQGCKVACRKAFHLGQTHYRKSGGCKVVNCGRWICTEH